MIQVLVALGITAIMAVAIATLLSNQNKEVKAISEKLLTKEIESQMKTMFSNSDYCNCLFRGKTFNTVIGSEAIVATDQITQLPVGYSSGPADSPPCTVVATNFVSPSGMPVPNSNMTIGTIGVTNLQLVSPANYKADMVISFANSVRSIKEIKTSIQFSVDPAANTATNRPFVRCGYKNAGATVTSFVFSKPISNGMTTGYHDLCTVVGIYQHGNNGLLTMVPGPLNASGKRNYTVSAICAGSCSTGALSIYVDCLDY